MAPRTLNSAVFGATSPEPAPRNLSAGNFHCLLINGAFRGISWCGIEIVRGLDCPIRDENWGTYSQTDVNEKFSETAGVVTYHRTFKIDGERLSGALEVTIDPNGALTAALALHACKDFSTNRAGFCLLHPLAGVAGQPLKVTRANGTDEACGFPENISPGQPVFDIRRLRHRIDGIDVSIEFLGEVFEMEDQRNWTDASFKTYCRPLALPMPYLIRAGETLGQEIRITASGEPSPPRLAETTAVPTVRFEPSKTPTPCPDILLATGLGWIGGDSDRPGGLAGVQGLVARIGAFETGGEAWIAELLALAETHAAYCDIEIAVPQEADPARHLPLVAANLKVHGLEPRHVMALPAAYLQSHQPGGDWPAGATPEDCARAAGSAFPGAEIGVGMLTNFTEVNRCRPKPGPGSYLTHCLTAIVHAADDRSVLETLEALPYVFATAQSFVRARGTRLGLVSIGMRSNPYGADVAPNPDCRRVPMATVDPRQQGLFAASFAVAATAIAAEAGCEAMALAAPAGPFAMANEIDAADGGMVFPNPIYHAIEGLSGLAGEPLSVLKNAPGGVYGLAARGTGVSAGFKGLVTNAALAPVNLTFEHRVEVTFLDETFNPAAAAPAKRSGADGMAVRTITLGPCATAFLTWEQSP